MIHFEWVIFIHDVSPVLERCAVTITTTLAIFFVFPLHRQTDPCSSTRPGNCLIVRLKQSVTRKQAKKQTYSLRPYPFIPNESGCTNQMRELSKINRFSLNLHPAYRWAFLEDLPNRKDLTLFILWKNPVLIPNALLINVVAHQCLGCRGWTFSKC